MTFVELMVFIQRWMILSDERMPKTRYDSLQMISRNFSLCSKCGMFVDMDLKDFTDNEALAVDSIHDIIQFLLKMGVEVTEVPSEWEYEEV